MISHRRAAQELRRHSDVQLTMRLSGLFTYRRSRREQRNFPCATPDLSTVARRAKVDASKLPLAEGVAALPSYGGWEKNGGVLAEMKKSLS